MQLATASADTGGRGAKAFDGHGGGSPGEGLPLSSGQIALWVFLATVTMLFAAFASSYLVRRTGSDWQRVALPSLVWLNTGILLVSSVLLAMAKRHKLKLELQTAHVGVRSSSFSLLLLSTILGVLFLAGQILSWQQLAAQGVYLPTNPHSSFFYILTGLHAVHLLGGIVYLCYALGRAWQARGEVALSGVATYWHFLAALWVGLLVFMSVF